MKKLFGTDGIRGIANKYPITVEMAMKTGKAVAFLVRQSGFSSVIIGKDTRISGDMLEAALSAGISSMGVNVLCAGIIPTPGIAFLASKIKEAGAGIVISASHNPYYDNGIKIFNSKGYKLSDDEEFFIEELIFNNELSNCSPADMLCYGHACDSDKYPEDRYGNRNRCGNGDEQIGSTILAGRSDELWNKDKKNDKHRFEDCNLDIGRIAFLRDSSEKYACFLKKQFKLDSILALSGLPGKSGTSERIFISGRYADVKKYKSSGKLKLVVDCSNGAASVLAPMVFTGHLFDSKFIFNSPNGKNINDNCGSQNTETLEKLVIKNNADIGLAFDGDADRLIAVDENADKITGDKILAICANHAKNKGKLKNNIVVSTVMSNIGLCRTLETLGINHVMTDVGDREVLRMMKKTGAVMGGEDSGHMIFSDCHTTGDGILTALQLITVMLETGKKLSSLATIMKVYPQILINVEVNPLKPDFMKIKEVADEIKFVENQLGEKGRVLVRYSGTQPLLRVMVEGPDRKTTEKYCKRICSRIKQNILLTGNENQE